MSKKILFIIASTGFQDFEYSEPRKILENAGFDIHVASDKKGKCFGSFGKIVNSDFSLNEVITNNYEGIVMIGGSGAWQNFANNKTYLQIAKDAKKLGAICIAPTIVSDSGIFKGLNVTGWDQNNEQINYIENNGAKFVYDDVVVSDKYVTANGPKAATKFGEELVELFK